MTVYQRQIDLAVRMIAEKGMPVDIERPGAPVGGTEATPGPAGDPELWAGVPMLFLPGKSEGFAALFTLLAGTEIPVGGVKALMAPHPTYTPNYSDQVKRGDEILTYHSKNGIEVLAPDGVPVLWYLRFMR